MERLTGLRRQHRKIIDAASIFYWAAKQAFSTFEERKQCRKSFVSKLMQMHEFHRSFKEEDLYFLLDRYETEEMDMRFSSQEMKRSKLQWVQNCQSNIMTPYSKPYFASAYMLRAHSEAFQNANSSEALCVNFFYPLIREKYVKPFFQSLGLAESLVAKISYSADRIRFEYASEMFVRSEESDGMYIDFFTQFDSGVRMFIETKGFNDFFHDGTNLIERIERKYGLFYREHLAQCPVLKKGIDKHTFIENFQLIRYLMHIDAQSYFLCFYPQKNKKVVDELTQIYRFLRPEWHSHVITMNWEGIIETFQTSLVGQKSDQAKRLSKHYAAFEERYLR